MNPLVTISFPAYNCAPFVRESLVSVLQQTYDNIELIIVDDRGSDNSMEIVNSVLKQCRKKIQVRIIDHKENRGQGIVRNISMTECQGKYIYFMDSDDLISPNAIELFVSSIEKHNADLVVGSFARDHKNGILENGFSVKAETVITGQYSILNYQPGKHQKFPVFMWNKLYNISFLRKNNIHCIHRYVEDVLFTFEVCINACSCVIIPQTTYYYNVANQQSTTTSLMQNNDMPLQTALIFSEIAIYKYKRLRELGKTSLQSMILIDLLGTNIFHLNAMKKSRYIDSENYSMICKRMLNEIPLVNINFRSLADLKSLFKIIYYFLLTRIPFKLRLKFIHLFNRLWYKL